MEKPITQNESPIKEQPIYIKAFIILIKLLGYGLATFILTGLLSMAMTFFASNLDPEDLQEGDISDWRSMSIIYIGVLIGTFLATYIFRVGIDRLPFQTIGLQWKQVGMRLVKGGVWSIAMLSAAFLILWGLGYIKVVDLQFEWIELLGFLFLFLLAALVEELIFRGYIITLIDRDFHFLAALLISSLLFAYVHVGNAYFTWWSFINIFLAGYLLGLIFIKEKELYTPLGLHWVWNFFQGNILGFGVSGYEVESLLTIDKSGANWLTGGEFGLEGSVITTLMLLICCIWLTYIWYQALSKSEVAIES